MKMSRLFLLTTASYGLVNTNETWHTQSDGVMFELGLKQCQQVPQLFYLREDIKLTLLAAKFFDDMTANGDGDKPEWFL